MPKNRRKPNMKKYFVPKPYYFPTLYAADLIINNHISVDNAIELAFNRYGSFGKRKQKHLKKNDFDKAILKKHLLHYLKSDNKLPDR